MSKYTAFAFGRFNPPTIGHLALINKLREVAKNNDYYIFTGQTKDNEKNPLQYGTKIGFLRLLFPQHANKIIQDDGIKNVLHAADYLESKGYTDVTFVCGSDRIEEFTKLLKAWNSIHTNKGKGFNTLTITSSGVREEGAEGVAGVSASLARRYAKENNFEAFKGVVPNDEKLAKEIFNAIRKEMGMNESIRYIKSIIREILQEQDEYRQEDEKKITAAKRKTALLKVKEEEEIKKSAQLKLKNAQDAFSLALRDTSEEAPAKVEAARESRLKAAQTLINVKKRVDAAKRVASSIK